MLRGTAPPRPATFARCTVAVQRADTAVCPALTSRVGFRVGELEGNMDRPCNNADKTCDGLMEYQPRDPLADTPPKWICDTCGKVEIVDDDPGTAAMFGDGN